MNWFTSFIGLDTAINDRAVEIATDLVAAQFQSFETRNVAQVTPQRRTLDEIGAAVAAGQASGAGPTINTDTALMVSSAHACARLLAQGLAQPGCKLLLTDDAGARDEATKHPLFEILSFSPNPEQTAFEFREQIGLHLALVGNAFIHKIYSGNRIVALWPVNPGDVTVHYHSDRSLTYDIAGHGNGLTSKDIWHIRGLSWNGYQGAEIIRLAREALGLSLATESFGSSLFRNGARVAGVVSLAGNPTKDQLTAAAQSWNSQHAGIDNANKTAFIGRDVASYTPIASTANEAQWTEARRHQIEEICRAFGVRPSMIYTTGATSYASVEQEFLAHVKFTLAPLHTRFEQSAAKALLTPAERQKGYRIKLNTNALLRGSIAERMQMINTMVPLGLMTPNEVRKQEDFPRFDFPEADLPRSAANIFGSQPQSINQQQEGQTNPDNKSDSSEVSQI